MNIFLKKSEYVIYVIYIKVWILIDIFKITIKK